ncbi:MAG: DNA ligase [Cytophagales bacterium]|nr:DNA ligase [Rhizobacter sp.]
MSSTPLPRRALLIALALLPLAPRLAHAAARPLMLANVYRPSLPLADYWVSEKYDGVRAYWDGQQLWTRHGHLIHAPTWFTAGWPAKPLDGELWAGRDRFTTASSAAAKDTPDDAAWQQMRYMVFDLPAHPGTFDERLPALVREVAGREITWLQTVAQRKLPDDTALQALLRETVRNGGEGLVLHRGASFYRGERSDDLLKLKEQLDAEATVIGHVPGKGKYAGLLGALWVQTPEGVKFRLGSGLRDADRATAPAIGSQVTYRYLGQHPSGAPRFASFVRVRVD